MRSRDVSLVCTSSNTTIESLESLLSTGFDVVVVSVVAVHPFMQPLLFMICSCNRNLVNWSLIMLIEYVANKAFHLQQFIFHSFKFPMAANSLVPIKPFHRLECHNILH
jgi:hypothetical protein